MTNLMSERARRMRREKGDAERRLWSKLRELNRRGFRFRQQAPIGPYVADFCDHTAKLVIEVDGGQHGEPAGLSADRRRTKWLVTQGYRVLRFWNHEVLTNIAGVEIAILLALGLLNEDEACRTVPSPLVGEGQGGGDCRTIAVGVPPTPNPSPQGGGESAWNSLSPASARRGRVGATGAGRKSTGPHHA
jgi:very-short-patch-repair endonuclease